MHRLLFDVPLWHLMLHREHRGMTRAKPGDTRDLKLQDELFEVLYTGEGAPIPQDDVNPAVAPWAERIHASCRALPQFARLVEDCRGDPAAAALGVQALMHELELPDPASPPAQPAGGQDDPLRRPIQHACQAAHAEIAAFRDAADGLAGVDFGPGPGSAGASSDRSTDLGRVRTLLGRLRNNTKLARIARLAGRFKRMAADKRRQRVRHGADEITNVEQGADLARVLPSELAQLNQPLLRLDFLRRLVERQTLQYQLVGADTLTEGPVIVLLDKSTSMDEHGRDEWAAAVTLALLEHASAQRRPFALLPFSDRIIREEFVRPGGSLPWDALTVPSEGATSIDTAIAAGLDIIAKGPAPFRRSDIVLITDGASRATRAAELRERARALQATILGVAIGFPAERLAPWCDNFRGATTVSTLENSLAESLFAA